MKKLLTILVAFFGFVSINAQIHLDSIRVERIAKTCQLWGHLKYFHPYLIDNSINWEKAFTDNINGVIESISKEEFKTAIQAMLNELHDPVTTVKENNNPKNKSDSLKYPIVSFIQDSILLVSIRDYNDLQDYNYCYEKFVSLKDKFPKASGVIFDLRSEFELTDDNKGYLAYYFPDFESYFSNKVLNIPGYKARFHDGFMPEDGSFSGGYSSGYYVKDERTIQPSSDNSNIKIVFIVNQYSELPRLVLALQQTGQGYILSTDSVSDASLVNTVNYFLEDSVEVRIRLDELAIDYKVEADYLLTVEKNEPEIFETARQFLKGIKKSNSVKTDHTEKIKHNITEPNTQLTGGSNYPDIENRLLAVAKIWTVIDYFFAYKDLMEDDWNKVLIEFIPRFINASDSLEYNLVVAEMYKHIQDGHGFIRSQVLSNYFGTAAPPIKVRFIENLPVVVDVFPDSIYSVKEIAVGDVITEINGEPVASVIEHKMKYKCASNQSAMLEYISWNILNGGDSTIVKLSFIDSKNKSRSIELPRYNSFRQYWREFREGRNNEPIIKLISNDIGYADLDRLTPDMVDSMFENFKDTKAIIFDMRGYPNGTAWTIASHLTNKQTVYAANFRRNSPMSMKVGDFYSENLTILNQPLPTSKAPYYSGKTVMLIDERTQSQAEHTGLFFEAANETKFIGSQTAGANGDVTNFQIPGSITLYFSGHNVRHIDGRQLQKIGLEPEIKIKPTIKGISSGKDEVLEKAIEYLNGLINE